MKRISTLAAAAAFAALLSACGLIPDQTVTNPLQIDGRSASVRFQDAGNLTSQAVDGISASETFTFQNGEDINIPVSPAQLAVAVGFEQTAVLDDPAGPETIELINPSVTVRLWEGAQTFGAASQRTQATASFSGTLPMTRESCDVDSCTYSFTDPTTAASLFTLTYGSADIGTIFDIVTTGPVTNYGVVQLELQANPDSLGGSSLTFTIEAGDGTISF